MYRFPLFSFFPPFNILDKVVMETQSKCVGDKIDFVKANPWITYLPHTHIYTHAHTHTHTKTFVFPSLLSSLSRDSLNLLLWIPTRGDEIPLDETLKHLKDTGMREGAF